MMSKGMSRRTWVLLMIGAVLFSLILSMRTTSFPLSQRMDFNDSPIYKYIGYTMLQGKVPYVDVFDHKGIYFYFLCALGCLIHVKWGAWLLLWALMLAILIVIFRTARRVIGEKESLFLTVCLGCGVCADYWQGTIPDTYALFCSLLSFSLLLDYFEHFHLKKSSAFAIGVLSGISFWIKPNMLIGTLVLCFCLILHMAFTKRGKLAVSCLLLFPLGFAAATAPALLWLGAHDALGAMVETYFLYNSKYVSFYGEFFYRLSAFTSFIVKPNNLLALLFLLLLLLISLRNTEVRKALTQDLLLWFSLATFAVCIIEACMPGNRYEQYTLLLYPSLLFMWISLLKHAGLVLKNKTVKLGLAALTMAIVLLQYGMYITTWCKEFWTKPEEEDREISFIMEHTEEGDTIQVISPYYAGLYLETNRPAATRYIFVQSNHFYALTQSEDHDLTFWREFIQMILDEKPRMLIVENDYAFSFRQALDMLGESLPMYKDAGKSSRFTFYILPADDNEEIPEYISVIEVKDDSIPFEVRVPQDTIDAYKRGEITREELVEIYREAFDSTLED